MGGSNSQRRLGESKLAPGVIFRTGDVELALGLGRHSPRVHAVLATLARKGVIRYGDWVETVCRQRPEPGAYDASAGDEGGPRDSELAGAGESARRGWEQFTLEDTLFFVFFHRVAALLRGEDLALANLLATLGINEYLGRRHGPESGAATFAGCLERLFAGKGEPYMLVETHEAIEMPAPEAARRNLPARVVLGDNPQLVFEAITKRTFALGGCLRLATFRSAVQPAMERLTVASKNKDRLPVLPACTPSALALGGLAPAEERLLSVIRNTENLGPDVAITVHGHTIRQVDYQQSLPPRGFSPSKTLGEPGLLSITSYPAEGGGVRHYSIRRRVSFDA